MLTGVFACSTAAIMIKASSVQWAQLAAYRCVLAAAVLAPLFVRDLRRCGGAYTRRHLAGALLPGVMLGLHFLAWVPGARMTLIANASLIVNMVPAVLPLLLLAISRERITRGEVAGTMLAMAGTLLLTARDARLEGEHLAGDVVCFVSMLLLAVYMALGRRNRHYPSVWLYIVPVYLVAGVTAMVVSLTMANPLTTFPAENPLRELALIAGLAVVPTVIGHSIINYTMRFIRGQVVGITNLGQFIFAGLMAWWLFDQVPSWTLYVASAMVLAGVLLAMRSHSTGAAGGDAEKPVEAEVAGGRS